MPVSLPAPRLFFVTFPQDSRESTVWQLTLLTELMSLSNSNHSCKVYLLHMVILLHHHSRLENQVWSGFLSSFWSGAEVSVRQVKAGNKCLWSGLNYSGQLGKLRQEWLVPLEWAKQMFGLLRQKEGWETGSWAHEDWALPYADQHLPNESASIHWSYACFLSASQKYVLTHTYQ